MNKLNENWITEKYIDFEYKKYILLAYLQEVNSSFSANKLYPTLADLLVNYNNVLAIKESKDQLSASFPKRLTGINSELLKVQYEKLMSDDAMIAEIEQIVNFSLPKLYHYLTEGKKIYDFIEEHIKLSPVGLTPLHTHEGYLLLKDESKKNINIYEYQVRLFDNATEKYRGIYTRLIDYYKSTFTNTFESIKIDLIRKQKTMPNPATYALESDLNLPLEETYLPIAKRLLVKYLSD